MRDDHIERALTFFGSCVVIAGTCYAWAWLVDVITR